LDGKDSPNTGWRNEAFRGFVDYLQTEEFRDPLAALIRLSREKRIATMCAEAVPWRCHRSVVGDALSVRGVPVVEILSESSWRMHQLTPFARVEGTHHISPRAGDPAVTKGPPGRGLEQELENAPDSVFGKAQIGRRRASRVSVEPPLIDSLTVERLRLGGLFSTRGISRCILPYSGHRGSGRTGMKVSEHESNFYHLLHRVARVECLVVIHGTERFSFIFRGSFLGARGGAAADNLSEPRHPTRGRASQS
jgi:Domain of unknown function DUF488